VALSFLSPGLGVTQHPALRSPDFPPFYGKHRTATICSPLTPGFTLAAYPVALLQGYIWKKLYIEHGDVFFCYALLWRSDAYEEHGDVFFCCMPFT
jgi:hypothetical protein